MNSKAKKKEKNVTFILQPRPQRDPLAADHEASQYVLVPKSSRDAELAKKNFPQLDPTLFPSEKQTRTGMLERAHQKAGMTFDTDILEAMSKDFDYEDPNNVLDDDFLNQAGGLIEEEGEMLDGEVTDLTKELFETEPEILMFNEDDKEDADDDQSDNDSDDYDVDLEDNEENGQCDRFGEGRRLILFKKRVKKKDDEGDFELKDQEDNRSTVFTNYSMTSSVMRRNQGLQQLDEHFERIYEKEYADETEIGALDLNDVGGEKLLTDMSQIQDLRREVKEVRKKNHGDDYVPEVVSEHHKDAIIGEDHDEADDLVAVEVTRRENRIDCESILSYSSNLYNHPKLIIEPTRRMTSQSTDNQMDIESDERSRSDVSRSMASSRATVLSKLSIRPANETPEERRARKKALKAYRHERRQERKQNQQIFKSEQANVMRQQRTNRPALKLA